MEVFLIGLEAGGWRLAGPNADVSSPVIAEEVE